MRTFPRPPRRLLNHCLAPTCSAATGRGRRLQIAKKRYASSLVSTDWTASVRTSANLLKRSVRDVGPEPVTSKVILESLWRLRRESLDELAPLLTLERKKPSVAARYVLPRQIQKQLDLASGKARCLR